MEERLQKILSAAGIASRRKAEEMIQAGRVRVNGNTAKLGDTADRREDVIEVDGKVLRKEPEKRYLMLNKPRGYVTTLSDEQGRKTVAELVADCGVRVYPVGRLDMDSEGLLILTNDGEVANKLMHPKHHVDKIYHVKIKGEISPEKLELLNSPMVIDDYKIKPVKVSIIERKEGHTILRFILSEGRNRQIRKMCEEAGLTVKRLSRVSIGNLKLDGLPVGKWRYLEQHEVDYLYKATKEINTHV